MWGEIMTRKLKIVLVVSGIITILIAFFLTLYYCVFNKQHTGPMDWWAIILLAIPTVILMISRIILDILCVEVDENFKATNTWDRIRASIISIVNGLATVLVLPIDLVIIIGIIFLSPFFAPSKRLFKKLIARGFKYKYENKYYILTKNEIIIRVFHDFQEYYISFDSGENFVRVEESDLGSSYDRKVLKSKLDEYINAHPVDKQRGDAVPPVTDFVDFLDHNLTIIN